MNTYVQYDFAFNGAPHALPRVCSAFFEGTVEIIKRNSSFAHEFGVQKRTDYVVESVSGYVALEDDDGDIVAELDYEELEGSSDPLKVALLRKIDRHIDNYNEYELIA